MLNVSTGVQRQVFALQREVLFRARVAISNGLGELGGIPSTAEESAHQELDRSAADAMTAVLLDAVGAARGSSILDGAFADNESGYWRAKTPAVLGFGARTFDGLAALRPRTANDPRWRCAAATFQLAAALLDWIGDEAGVAGDVVKTLPPAPPRNRPTGDVWR